MRPTVTEDARVALDALATASDAGLPFRLVLLEADMPGALDLMAQDSLASQKVTVGFLERWGHTAVAVASGGEALTAIEQQPFDLVLMDVHMPEMDGLQATAAIRSRERVTGGHLPIVAMTASA